MTVPTLSVEAVEAIEDAPLSPEDRVSLLLTALGLRQLSIITIRSTPWREGDERIEVDINLMLDVATAIFRAELSFEKRDSVLVEDGSKPGHRKRRMTQTRFLVTKTQEIGEIALRADEIKDADQLARLLGHPESSRKAVKNDKVKPIEDLLLELILTDGVRFLDFPLSEEWEKELTLVESWVRAVREASPRIYNDLVRARYCRASKDKILGYYEQYARSAA